MTTRLDVAAAPGHLIRRAHQMAVAIFAEHLSTADVTPVQFAILSAVLDAPGIDQISLAKRVAFDAATSGSVIGRLEVKGWLRRHPDVADRRRKLLVVTPEGAQALHGMQQAVARVQAQILSPLSSSEQAQFVSLLVRLVQGHESTE